MLLVTRKILPHYTMKKIVTLLVLLFTGIALFSQTQNIIFNEITDKEGLNQYYNNRALFQDHMGFIWIGSFSGLQRFDGYEFKDYTDKINPKWLYSISEDKRSILWIGSSTGLYLLNPENDKVKYFAPPECKGIFKVYEDKNGIIWCAAAPNGLMRVEPKIKNDGKLKELIFNNGVESAFNISIFKYGEFTTDQMSNFVVRSVLSFFMFHIYSPAAVIHYL